MKTNLYLFLIISLLITLSSAKQSGRSHTRDLTSVITRFQFEEMLKHRNDSSCSARGGWPSPIVPDGPETWGYCTNQEAKPSSDYCSPSTKWPCTRGKRYYGRGPMQLKGNINYGQCGKAIGADLLNHPDLLTKVAIISFKSAIWFWMTAQPPNPSCHAVVSGQWKPSAADRAAGRLPGYAMINIIIAPSECGIGADTSVADRIGFYERYCKIFGVTTGKNIACYGF